MAPEQEPGVTPDEARDHVDVIRSTVPLEAAEGPTLEEIERYMYRGYAPYGGPDFPFLPWPEPRSNGWLTSAWLALLVAVACVAFAVWGFANPSVLPGWLKPPHLLAFAFLALCVWAALRTHGTRIARTDLESRQEKYHRQQVDAIKQTSQDASRLTPPVDEGVALATLMTDTRRQIDKYHAGTMNRADTSFRYAMVSFAIGLLVLVAAAAVAIWPPHPGQTPWAASGLGALGGVLATYITSTHLLTHRLSLAQLNHYFNQPVVTYEVLQAERLAKFLPADDGQGGTAPGQTATARKLAEVIDTLLAIAQETCIFSMHQALQTSPATRQRDINVPPLGALIARLRGRTATGQAPDGSATPGRADAATAPPAG